LVCTRPFWSMAFPLSFLRWQRGLFPFRRAGRGFCQPGIRHDFRQGLEYILGHRMVKFVIVVFFLAMLPPMGGLNTLQVFLLRDIFAYPETIYGILMTFYGVGLVLGAFVVGRLARWSELKIMILGMAAYGLFYASLWWGETLFVAAAALTAIVFVQL
jgi:Na+/melibiose symporter-like transporter